jgi:hypothetical protein
MRSIVVCFGFLLLGLACMAQGNAASEQTKKLYSPEVYATKVINIFPTNNAAIFRNKMVETLDSLIYFVDYTGRSILIGSSAQFYIPDVVTISGEQSISGKKTFADTLKAGKGLVSSGLIDTKGLNTQGSSSKAAVARRGVESSKDTTVSINYAASGAYGTVTFNCVGSDLTGTLPPYNADTEDWIIEFRKSGTAANKLTVVDTNNVLIYETSSNFSIKFKNISGQWKRISVAMY